MSGRIYADTKFLLCVIKLHNQHKFHKCYLPFDMLVFVFLFEKAWFVSSVSLKKKTSEYYYFLHFIFSYFYQWIGFQLFVLQFLFALFVFYSDIPDNSAVNIGNNNTNRKHYKFIPYWLGTKHGAFNILGCKNMIKKNLKVMF